MSKDITKAQQLYLNLKCKPFTFILGNSGADMTVLPRALAACFGATEENGRYLQLQVRPDWMDSSDLFGWLNLEGKFIPGVMIDFLKIANEDRDHHYFLCLNRLILSRAEYYLRDLFNAIDSRGEEEPKPYVPAIYYGRDEEALQKYGVIPVLPNLSVVATVNLDETSLPLNQRLLDRVHTMTLTESIKPEIFGRIPQDLSTTYYGIDRHKDVSVVEAYISAFEQVNQILIKATSYLGFKIRNEAILYLLHNREIGLLPENVAMDQVLCEKVLPRLQGNSKLIGPVLEAFLQLCQEKDYPITADRISHMIAQCNEKGYCSCWS